MANRLKSALVSGAVATALCVGAFAGATMAWFTDSISSGDNVITAGELKVDLLMYKDGEYKSINGVSGGIFSETADGLWEPGKTQIVYLAVRNLGSLALNYNIIVDVADGGLAGALEYALVDGAGYGGLADVNSWETFVAASGGQNGAVTAGRTVAAQNGTLDEIANGEKNETDYFAFAVHMDADADLSYMGKSVTINVSVLAKQATGDKDGFGNGDYDKDAPFGEAVSSAEELNAALAEGKAVYLTKDISGTITVPAGVTAVVDLNGNTVSGSDGDAIVNNGNLALKGGTIDGTVNGKCAVQNNSGATVTLENCTVLRSTEGANNTFYTVRNYGTMIINDGTVIKNSGASSSCITNGYNDDVENAGEARMIINGGTFSGGLNTVKNDYYGVLEINGGTFDNAAGVQQASVLLNWNKAVINGGTFTAGGKMKQVLSAEGKADASYSVGELTVNDGKFDASTEGVTAAVNLAADGKLALNGGSFYISSNGSVIYNTNETPAINVTGGEYTRYTGLSAYLSGEYVLCSPATADDTMFRVVKKEELAEGCLPYASMANVYYTGYYAGVNCIALIETANETYCASSVPSKKEIINNPFTFRFIKSTAAKVTFGNSADWQVTVCADECGYDGNITIQKGSLTISGDGKIKTVTVARNNAITVTVDRDVAETIDFSSAHVESKLRVSSSIENFDINKVYCKTDYSWQKQTDPDSDGYTVYVMVKDN